jgi:2-keto-3-deoxy-L-rhamnonate aldolase RhmA
MDVKPTPKTEGNPFRLALSRGQTLIGIWSMLNSSNVIEALAQCGYDWILIDGEHSPVNLADAMAHLRAMGGSDTVPIVRLAWNDPVQIKQFLDGGACTIMLPYIQSAAEARDAVAAMRYPPRGRRGVAVVHRASRYGHNTSYLKSAEDSIALIVQIETEHALERLDEIARTDGVDAVFFGPSDLAASMGLLGQPSAPAVIDAILRAHEQARRYAKTGVLATSPELAERYIREGFDFVSVANDAAALLSNARAAATRFVGLAAESARSRG